MKKQIKSEFKGQTLSNSKIGDFKVDSITEDTYQFFEKMGFAHIFEMVCEKCENVSCTCKVKEDAKKEIENIKDAKEFVAKSRGKKDESNN